MRMENMDKAAEDSRYSTEYLVKKYLFALSLIALLVVSSHYYVLGIIGEKASYSTIINLAGRQRMLSQKIAKNSLLMAQGGTAEINGSYRNDLISDTDNLSKTDKGLRRGDKEMGLPESVSPEIEELFAKIDPYQKKLIHAVAVMLALGDDGAASLMPDSPLLVEIVEASESYLKLMDMIVKQYEREARMRNANHERIETLIMFSVLLLLVLVALFIFQPMVKKVRGTYAAIRGANESLTAEIWERKQAEERLTENKNLLEKRVAERTAKLTDLNRTLKSEIEKRELANKAKKKSERFLKTVFDGIQDGLNVVDRDFNILYANRALEKFHNNGHSICGQQCYKVFHERNKPCDDCTAIKTFTTGKSQVDTVKKSGPQGENIWLEVSAFPIYGENGTVTAVVETFRDVTERVRTEEELRSAKQLLEKTFASLDEAVFVVNPENRAIITCNPAVERLFGYTEEEVIGRNTEFLHVDKAAYEEFDENIIAGLESNGNYRAEYRMKKKDGTVFTCDHTVTEIRDESGKCTELVAVFSDITEKRLMEQELAKSQKLESLGLLAGGIAHDFNNILMGILGNISIAKFLTGSNNRSLKVLAEAEKAAMRARGLTNQLLTFSSGGTPLMRVTRIKNLLKDVTQFALRGSNSKAELKPAKNLAPVEIDSDQITQVINNLVINADQAMPDGGVVTVSANNVTLDDGEEYPLPAGDYVKISVADHGIGIPDGNLDRIFDPFFTTKNMGNGLGLSSSYSIIKNHGGLIKVSSKPGEGATFTVYLPAINKPVLREKKKIKTIKGTENILVMDDDEMVREVLSEMLTELGYKPKMARDGKEAVVKYRRAMNTGEPFAAVILDHTIKGGMGGLKTIEKLKEMDPDVNAIISSGYTTGVVSSDYEKLGFSGFVAKPYELETLSQLLDKTITAKKQLSVLGQLGLS